MLTKKAGEWLELSVPRDWEGLTIEDILKNAWSMPKQMIHQLRMEKGVRLNGESIYWNTPLAHNDKLRVHLFIEEDYGVQPEYIPELNILFEDDHLLIANKPPRMDTHPNEENQLGTLANAIAYHFQANGVFTKVRHIHRLDRDTTGAVIFAKHKLASAILDRRLEKREIKRTYLALVHGIIKQKKGTIDAAIGRDRHHPTRRRVSQRGQKAITTFKVVQTFVNKKMTLVELELLTGRTHQIRVHMSHLGYPLAGDTLYGGQPIVPRQALHAARISLEHPLTNEKINCEAPFLDHPPIFDNLLV
ncbi:RluA family pseudouridine synthase [Bacillus sp. REN16]|uniref:RluA family pseudouridine synthase n=1 Tax=Bacillus sp. REN16 TaxID=2887296 RepID=UPI001E4908DF|nr:RluA family pseudouridine synthase [Bacillus sp. REN16]MCC3355334.1 RluA family pseudouridine synthase [Bacillus sp. REN16]